MQIKNRPIETLTNISSVAFHANYHLKKKDFIIQINFKALTYEMRCPFSVVVGTKPLGLLYFG